MRVRDLIAALQQVDPDATVVVRIYEDDSPSKAYTIYDDPEVRETKNGNKLVELVPDWEFDDRE